MLRMINHEVWIELRAAGGLNLCVYCKFEKFYSIAEWGEHLPTSLMK